jgi:hypothetical protein
MQLTIPQIETNGRLLFYGIETSQEWLVNYMEKYKNDYDLPDCMCLLLKLNNAMRLLSLYSGISYRKLGMRDVLPENTPIPPPPKGFGTLRMQTTNILIITVCSSRPRSFQKRPSRAKMDALKKIMDGKEPRWWFDDAPF